MSFKEKLIAAKERWAREGRLLTEAPLDPSKPRLPPGQREVQDWPVLDLGVTPNLSQKDWLFTVGGAVERPVEWHWDEFMAQPQLQLRLDMH